MSSWRKISIVILIALLALCVFIAITSASTTSYSAESVAKDYNIPIGQSMFENQSIVGTSENVEVPLVANVGFLTHQLMAFDLQGILRGVTTGIVPFDFSVVSSEGIDSYGKVVDIVGPGYLTFEGDKLAVKAPDNYVWGYSAPYKWLEKTESGVDVYENGTKIKSVPVDEIRNLDYHNDYYNASTIASWYNYDAQVGSTFTLEKGMVGFSDGRNNISSSDVPKIFGQSVVDYAAEYPTGSPILLYSGNYTTETGEVYGTSLGSHPEYGDSIREINARQFVEAWNGTVIPPNTTASGKDYVYFESASDASAPGGSAAHGVCPSARALRAAVTSEGFGLPTGMTWDENAVLFGYNPARDITVYNNHDFPVEIRMWTEGSGTGMGVYAQVIRYIPND
ncbi:MAG: hypothetical protein IKI27_00530 [Methanobrevibacter sp.]|uniref:hypothetical protein n=1 Tax=Methanobrevibacter sp. TaxID=66852 RepID=UPI00257D19DE|nr:hypothetical protein [Methanobrevibacter sp.]MBR2665275.1 hypothetical protein [Methanobrevibacter sp.]MBR3198175.1 hypothetical protein [Methanobrevibacter sp.]MBR6927833.1 hypothetical protein [Methanobrevibacter sp.]MBR7049915.1 hypothetical protein [Methanobrevibacter sp.]